MSSSKAEDHTNLQEGRPVDSGSEIPRQGRSPDFVLRGSALPGFPVVRTHTPAIWPVRRFLCRSAPVHSDCIAPDSHRIPFSPALRRTPWRYNFTLFQTVHIITHDRKESTGKSTVFPIRRSCFPAKATKTQKCPAGTRSAGRFGSSARDYCINVPAIIWSM